MLRRYRNARHRRRVCGPGWSVWHACVSHAALTPTSTQRYCEPCGCCWKRSCKLTHKTHASTHAAAAAAAAAANAFCVTTPSLGILSVNNARNLRHQDVFCVRAHGAVCLLVRNININSDCVLCLCYVCVCMNMSKTMRAILALVRSRVIDACGNANWPETRASHTRAFQLTIIFYRPRSVHCANMCEPRSVATAHACTSTCDIDRSSRRRN